MNCDGKDLIRSVCSFPNGLTLVSRHRPDHSVEPSVVRRTPVGTPMMPGEEYVTTKPREDGSFEIVDSYVHAGPAQVATEGYRTGWERTFNAPGGSA